MDELQRKNHQGRNIRLDINLYDGSFWNPRSLAEEDYLEANPHHQQFKAHS